MWDYETYCKIRDHFDRQGLTITQTARARIYSSRRTRFSDRPISTVFKPPLTIHGQLAWAHQERAQGMRDSPFNVEEVVDKVFTQEVRKLQITRV
jgi:hypothetical protein